MLSKGGEVATPWALYKLDPGTTEILIMGTLRQFDDLCAKLKLQPFGLAKLSRMIKSVLSHYDISLPILQAGRFSLDFSMKTHIMGILNLTPDSFSDGGRYMSPEAAIDYAIKMVEEGADIIDIGGESTRPGAEPVDAQEALKRTIPVIEALVSELDVPISIDTYKPLVARTAIEAGAGMINDISGLRDNNMIELALEKGVPVIVMHMKGAPGNMQVDPVYGDVVGEICDWLDDQTQKAISAGLMRENILIDPGIGFGKTFDHNLEILSRLSEFRSLGYPIVLGTSRKAFLGALLDALPEDRLEGTIATVVQGISNGANIVRVHDVKQVARACKVVDAVKFRQEHSRPEAE
ncbi:MAG: dihydropteroate synthase [Rubrobacteridae bacterium]|nr:dihydropteroate synthase [Rubrobacteridae bacterium]